MTKPPANVLELPLHVRAEMALKAAVEKVIVEHVAFSKFTSKGPQKVRLSQEELIKTSYLEGHEGFPLVVQPNVDNVNLVTWASCNNDFIKAQLLKFGAILFRGFDGAFHRTAVDRFEMVLRDALGQRTSRRLAAFVQMHVSLPAPQNLAHTVAVRVSD